jgi:ABC-type nitrate/sulfonate/bicarbonate transport system permease component
MKNMYRTATNVLKTYLPLMIAVIVWELYVRIHPEISIFLPSPSDVFAAFVDLIAKGTLQTDIYASLKRVFIAIIVAGAIGYPLALVMAMSKPAQWFFEPIINFFRPIPPLAWIPLSIVWFGISDSQNIFIIFLGAFFPILLNTYEGARSINDIYIRAARNLGATRISMFFRIILPAALPAMFVGLRVGGGVAWMALVAGELVAASSGLGHLISQGRLLFKSDQIIVGMVTIGIIGILLDSAVLSIQRILLRWKDTR